MKPTSSFKFKKEYKRVAATINDKHKRGEYIKRMIVAQLHLEEATRAPLSKKDKE